MGLVREIGKCQIEITVGKGLPGPKTLGLRNDRTDIQASGFHYPINVALTPQFLQRRLLEAGITVTDDRDNAFEKLKKVPFTEPERTELKRALLELPTEVRSRLIVRSDESAEGTGLLTSRRTSETADVDSLILEIEKIAGEILSGEYGTLPKLYRKIVGMETNTGVSLMPFYGERFVDLETGRRQISPVFGMNFLGLCTRRNLLSVSTTLSTIEQLALETPNGTRRPLESGQLLETLGTINRAPPYPRYRRSLRDRIMNLIERTGARYLEIVRDGWDTHDYVVVQSAPYSCPATKKPDRREYERVVKTKLAFGIASARIRECKYVHLELFGESMEAELQALKEYDSTHSDPAHKGYLLVINGLSVGMVPDLIYRKLMLANPGALLICAFGLGNKNMAFSHLGGFFRALGIPILIADESDEPSSFLRVLREKREMELDCLVYANQFERSGIVGIKREK